MKKFEKQDYRERSEAIAKQYIGDSSSVLIHCPQFGTAFWLQTKPKTPSGMVLPMRPVRHTDLNNFLRRKARLLPTFPTRRFIFSLEGFPYNASIPGLINQPLVCSRVVMQDVARIVPMFQKEV